MENIAETLTDLIVKISTVKHRGKNPRKGDVELIKESLEVNGQYRPIVVNKNTGEVLAGNHTLKAAKALGWKKIAATFVEASEEEAARIVLVDNRANDVATYENTVLVDLLKEFEDLKGTGYTNADITTILQELGADAVQEGDTDPDDIPDLPEEPTTKLGDVWKLGNHRLICGDSTSQEVVEKLMDGRQADLLLTDPPYGVSYSQKQIQGNEYQRKMIANGTRKGSPTQNEDQILNDDISPAALEVLLTSAFKTSSAVMKAGSPSYVFLSDANRMAFELALRSADLVPRQTLIWAKSRIVFGRQDYHGQHEPILYGWKSGAAHKWYGAFDKSTLIDETQDIKKMTKDDLVELLSLIRSDLETTIIRYQKPQSSDGLHPTTKPVGLLEKLINNSSQYGDAVLDIFAGSGSTLIACERLGRHGYMVELDPPYCDVIVKRWEDHTGKIAEQIS